MGCCLNTKIMKQRCGAESESSPIWPTFRDRARIAHRHRQKGSVLHRATSQTHRDRTW